MWQYTHPVRRYAQRDVLLALSFVLGKAQSDGLHKKTSKQEIPEHLLANLPLADHSERMMNQTDSVPPLGDEEKQREHPPVLSELDEIVLCHRAPDSPVQPQVQVNVP